MSDNPSIFTTIADSTAVEWVEHPRLKGIFIRQLLTSADNPLANVNEVLVPPGGVIGWHDHPGEVETVYVLSGESVLTLGEEEFTFRAGHVVAIPAALTHKLRNVSEDDVHLLTIFTPPIA